MISAVSELVTTAANWASLAGAIFSIASFIAVVNVRRTVKSAILLQTRRVSRMRASGECHTLAAHIREIHSCVRAKEWTSVYLRCSDARRTATTIEPLLSEVLGSERITIGGTIAQINSLERAVRKAISEDSEPDLNRIGRIVRDQETFVFKLVAMIDQSGKSDYGK